MNELNNNWVVWAVILSVVVSLISIAGFTWKMFRGMNGLEHDYDDKQS